MGIQQIIDAEVDGGARGRPVFEERGHISATVEVRVELVGPVEGEPLIVAELEAVGKTPRIPPDRQIPLPAGPESAPLAGLVRDRIVDRRVLKSARELRAKSFPKIPERGVDGQRAKVALARAQIAGTAESVSFTVDDQDLILEHAYEVVAEIQLEQPVAKQRMLNRPVELPVALRL